MPDIESTRRPSVYLFIRLSIRVRNHIGSDEQGGSALAAGCYGRMRAEAWMMK